MILMCRTISDSASLSSLLLCSSVPEGVFAAVLANFVPDVVPQMSLVVVTEEVVLASADPGVAPLLLLVDCVAWLPGFVGSGLLDTEEGDPGVVPVPWLGNIPDEGVDSIASSTGLPAGANGPRPCRALFRSLRSRRTEVRAADGTPKAAGSISTCCR